MVPDHLTLNRRAETLDVATLRPGSNPVHLLVYITGLKVCDSRECLVEKHRMRIRRPWRGLHIGTDVDTGQIAAAMLSTSDVDDAFKVGRLLDQVYLFASLTADGAYGRMAARSGCQTFPGRPGDVLPRSGATPNDTSVTAS